MILVSGGGWGVGDLERAIELALADGETEVVCIAGRNEHAQKRLEARFADNERVRVLGFTDQMSDWMAAADAMVHATAGLTVLEAHIRGCPVISYGFSAGHLRANNAAFERFGIAEVARSDHELEIDPAPRRRRAPLARLLVRLAALDRLAGARGAAARAPGAGLAAAHGARRRGRLPGDHRGGAGDLGGPPREPAEAAAPGHQPDPHRHRQRPHAGDPGGEEARPGRILARRRDRNRRSRSRVLERRPRRAGGARSPGRGGRGRPRGRDPARGPGAGADRPRGRPAAAGGPARGGRRGRRPHLRRRPAPAGHPGGAGDPPRGGRRRRPSSSPASRSSSARPWRRRSSPPATGSSSTATATATSCG